MCFLNYTPSPHTIAESVEHSTFGSTLLIQCTV